MCLEILNKSNWKILIKSIRKRKEGKRIESDRKSPAPAGERKYIF